jgi:hypothetical protein
MRISAFTIAIFVSIVVFSSCKKTTGSNPITNNNVIDTLPLNVITATINDTDFNFSYKVEIDTGTASQYYKDLNITGQGAPISIYSSGNDSSYITLFLSYSYTLLSTGIYSQNNTYNQLGGGEYQPSSSITYYSAYGSSNPFIINVTSIDSNSTYQGKKVILINGTFQGEIYLNGDSSSQDKKVITNGKFNVSNL